MPFFELFLPVFSVLLSFISPAVAIDPSTVQLDLVFPRNGSIYKPVYPFPIVFAIHNAAVAWPYEFIFDWSIYARADNGTNKDTDFGGFSVDKDQNLSLPDQFLFINSSATIINTTSTRFFLRTSFGIANNCSLDISAANPGGRRGYISNGDPLWFYLSPDGELPNILNLTECPKTISTFGIHGSSEDPWGGGPRCPVLTDPSSPPKKTCAFKPDAEVARQVESAMLRTASCTSGSWPNATGLVQQCAQQKQSAAMRSLSVECLLAALLALFSSIAIMI